MGDREGWRVLNVRGHVHAAVKAAADHAGVTIGDWIARAVRNQLLDDYAGGRITGDQRRGPRCAACSNRAATNVGQGRHCLPCVALGVDEHEWPGKAGAA